MTTYNAKLASHRVGLRKIAPRYPRQGRIVGVFPLIKGGHALTYTCGGKSYAAYLSPGVEETLRVGQQVVVSWRSGEDYAEVKLVESVAPVD